MPTPNDPKRQNTSDHETASAAQRAAQRHDADRDNRTNIRRRADDQRHQGRRHDDDPYIHGHDDYRTDEHPGNHSGLGY